MTANHSIFLNYVLHGVCLGRCEGMSPLVCAGTWLEDDFECPLLSLSILSVEPEPLTD